MLVEVDFPRFMATSMLDIDVQPTYFRVTVRRPEKLDKVIQVWPSCSFIQRFPPRTHTVGSSCSFSCFTSAPVLL